MRGGEKMRDKLNTTIDKRLLDKIKSIAKEEYRPICYYIEKGLELYLKTKK
jgi:hypothetical protein